MSVFFVFFCVFFYLFDISGKSMLLKLAPKLI